MPEKENRCWPGYEPVKGKPEHSQGSCKPKAESKSTPSEKEFRAARKKQLDQWKQAHASSPGSAAQHLSAPGAAKKTATKAKPARKKRAAARKRSGN